MTPALPTRQQPAAAASAYPAWTTPQILKSGLAGIWIACILLMVSVLAGARNHRHAVQVVGKDSAPSIIAAQHIRAALADMDANAASDSLERFEMRRTEAVQAIVAAAENITYGNAERKPIHALALGMGTYSAQVQAARDKRDVAAWREAQTTMDSVLLPAAADLDKANRVALDEAYDTQKKSSSGTMAMLIVAGILLGGVIIPLQVFLARRMRRTLNPLLFLATVMAYILVIYAGQRFNASDRDLKVAKEDAFESIHSLWQARAMAYSANGALSRAALDPLRKSVYLKDFEDRAGEAANHLDNDKARAILAKFSEYRTAKSTAALEAFDRELQATQDVKEQAFRSAVDRGFADEAGFEFSIPVWVLTISLIAWLGLRPRIREYSV
jgi:Tfp pilus assembly protein PilV